MKRTILILNILVLAFSFMMGQGNQTAQQVLTKAVGIIANTKGVETKFTIYNSGYSGTGVIKSLGNKFNVTLPDVEIWYNGNDLYT